MNKANSIINKCGPFAKHTQRIQDFLNTGKLSYIYKNYLDKACF